MSPAPRARLAALVVAAAFTAACSHDWSFYDPTLAGGTGGGAGGGSGGGAGGGTTTTTTASGGGAGGSPATTGTGGAGGAMSESISLTAAVAECIDPVMPDPAYCESRAGAGAVTIDGSDGMLGNAFYAFFRFDLDPVLDGKVIDSVTLRLTGMNTASDQSGEVWQVEPFTLADLSAVSPATIGMAPIAADLGPVSGNVSVTWSLPTDIIASGVPVCLGVLPVSTDGVDYWKGPPSPPLLIVDYH